MTRPFFEKAVLEKEVERDGCDYAFRRGWVEYKVTSPSKNGFPDRFYARNGVIILVEWKRPGEDTKLRGGLSGNQVIRHRELRAAGVRVEVIYTLEQAYEIFR